MSGTDVKPEIRTRKKRIVTIVVIAIIAAIIGVVSLPLLATVSPEFFARYGLLERRYVNLGDSAHEGIGCRACHETQPFENAVALVADYYTSLVVKDAPEPSYFTFEPPSREACLDCHEDDWSTELKRTDRIPHPAHLRVADETRNCVDCHKWTAHLESYIDNHKEMPFSGVCVAYGCHVGTKATEQCFNCHHVLHENAEQWTTEHPAVANATGKNACFEQCHEVKQCQTCHTTGERPDFSGLPIQTEMKAIEELHVKPEWTPLHHGEEALKNRDNCLLCHQSEGECNECHLERPEFHGSTDTWIGRHKDSSDAIDDPRCIECHEQAWCEDCHEQFEEME